MATPLFIQSTLYDGPNSGPILIPYVDALPIVPTSSRAVILDAPVGTFVAGMYVYDDTQTWRYAMPIEAVSAIVVGGDTSAVYINITGSQTLGPTSIVYRNGQLQVGHDIEPAAAVYAVRYPSGAALSEVKFVNNIGPDVNGNIALTANDIPGISTVGKTGLYSDLIGAPDPYVLPIATATVLGGVMVPLTSHISVDGQGNIDLSSATMGLINGKIGTLTSLGVGSSLIASQGGGNANMRSLVAGTNIMISDDGNNGLVIASTGGGSGTVTLTGDVTGSGTGTVPTVLSATGVTPGTYKSVTVDTKGRVTAGTNPTTLAGFGITDALPLVGGTMTGNITMSSGSTVTGIPDPVNPLDSVNKQSLDAALAAAANGVFWKTSVQAATTANVTLSGLQTTDGYAVQSGDRVLVKNQTNPIENGVYVASSSSWTRATDTDTGAEIFHAAVLILNGTTQALEQWTNTNSTQPVVGTDPITWGQLRGAANVYTAGAGIQISGLTVSIANTGVAAGTYTKVTVNAQGQVIAGTNLSASDINTALGYTPYNGTTNPSGFIGGLTATGDATGTAVVSGASGSIALTLANSGVTAGTYTSVTVDAKGRVTVGGSISQAQILSALGFTPVNKAGDTMAGALNWAPLVTVSSAATTPIGAAGSNAVIISGTTTITAFDTIASGATRDVTFNGVLTLTYNATSLILPTAANITTAAGDTATFESLGGGNWRCISYQRANGQPLAPATDNTKLPLAGGTMSGAINGAPQVILTAAATTPIGAANANDLTILGTTTINAFDTIAAGAVRKLTFAGALTLTNSSNLILPTGANITTAAGDVAEFTSLGSNNWRCDFYTRATGQPLVAVPDATKLPLAGGTMTGAVNFAAAVALTTASTVNIGAANSNNVTISGAGTITAFDSVAAGTCRTVVFGSSLTLQYNPTALILPTSASINAAVGDSAEFESLGSGNWRCLWYQRANGSALSTGSPFTTTQIFNGSTGAIAAKFTDVAELVNVVGSGVPAAATINVSSGAVTLYTGAATANWVPNIQWAAGVTLNSIMSIGDALTVVIAATQGGTPFAPTSFQIDGSAVAQRWLGGNGAPAAGNANSIDAYTYTIIKTASGTYTVLAAQSQYK